MAKITTTSQMKKTTMPGRAYPPTVLATSASYPASDDLFRCAPPPGRVFDRLRPIRVGGGAGQQDGQRAPVDVSDSKTEPRPRLSKRMVTCRKRVVSDPTERWESAKRRIGTLG
jgi:hypothetical protein